MALNIAVPGAGESSTTPRLSADDWENWEDDDGVTPIDTAEQVVIDGTSSTSAPLDRTIRTSNVRASRQSAAKLKRLRSRHRQQAQNARAGIKLITDMNAFRRPQNVGPDGKSIKFVDAAALRALEGEPNSASVGNWNWLKKKGKSPISATPIQSATPIMSATPIQSATPTQTTRGQELSPEDRPIVIGLFPDSLNPRSQGPAEVQNTLHQQQQVSVWSPDTPDTSSSSVFRPASSVYSSATALTKQPTGDIPPVPALPDNYKKTHHQRLISLDLGNDEADSGTPCTLFEEDGVPSPQRSRGKLTALTPDSAGSRSHGWWDHVVTPFMDKRLSFASRKARLESPREDEESEPCLSAGTDEKYRPAPLQLPQLTVRESVPRPPSPETQADNEAVAEPMDEKTTPRIIVTESSLDQPPPYSPPKRQGPVRYRAMFPPGHPLNAQFPPSPKPGSPGLPGTMSSQHAMTEIPITPTMPRDMPVPPSIPLPNRPIGTSLPREHAHAARGPDNLVERQRRRHEKEEMFARRAGAFWRGRGCMPTRGCFGRTGAEGRKRRRVCLGATAGIVVIIILVTVLSVMLTRPEPAEQIPSIWVNLTDYPPMPTGVLTMEGPDNTISRSGCTKPSTVWSCSVPPEQQEALAPHKPNQPTIIMDIQWDNGTSKSWDVANGDPPKPVKRSSGATRARSIMRKREKKFNPDPEPPAFEEMWFLGDNTDGIESDEKAGEPTPFYISILDEPANQTTHLDKRQTKLGDHFIKDLVPPPDLLGDGTPALARMLPTPAQQPVRLYDRGLPTEHYGFYTYFKRTIYLKSVTRFNQTQDDPIPLDEDGGCTKTEANYLATWSQTRMLVQIWTRKSNDTSLLGADGERPGSMPYPVTVSLDTHGGDRDEKFLWMWTIDDRQKLDLENPELMSNRIDFAGDVINHRSNGDPAHGGFDGGVGGCKCEWVNWT